MPGLFLLLRDPRRKLLRLASLALLALQGAVALSPLVEGRSEQRLGAHAEQDGARHLNLHNEDTCALCSARAQTAMPAEPAPAIAGAALKVVAAMETYAAPAREQAHHNRSRAPPR